MGSALPPWLPDSLAQAQLFTKGPVYLVAEAAALSGVILPGVTPVPLEEIGLSPKHRAFRESSFLDRDFRGGFWTFTTERFFVLESAMAYLRLSRVVHLENDVLLYADLDALIPKLAGLYPGMAATFDNDDRCVPGFVYVAGATAAGGLTDFLLAALAHLRRLPPQQVRSVNDMVLLAGYRKQFPALMAALPIVPPDYPAPLRSAMGHAPADPALYARDFPALGQLFDAAALGQFLGGIDPRNAAAPSRGFVNESCLFDPRLLKPRLVRGADGLRRPMIETQSGLHPVANLHIHAKQMGDFLSAVP